MTLMTFFKDVYKSGTAPWIIDRPQPAFKRVLKEGFISGDVLDVGCGVGDNSIFLAKKGFKVVGIDFVDEAIQLAKSKALDANVKIEFIVKNALQLEALGRAFDTIIDSGLFHTFSNIQRVSFIASLKNVLKIGGIYIMMCFSELEKGNYGPRRISKEEIKKLFKDYWEIQEIRPEIFESNWGNAKAWLSLIRRIK